MSIFVQPKFQAFKDLVFSPFSIKPIFLSRLMSIILLDCKTFSSPEHASLPGQRAAALAAGARARLAAGAGGAGHPGGRTAPLLWLLQPRAVPLHPLLRAEYSAETSEENRPFEQKIAFKNEKFHYLDSTRTLNF